MRQGRVIRMKHITTQDVLAHPERVYVVDDDLARTGLGGHPGAMRSYPNAIGVLTKHWPGQDAGAFLNDADWERRPGVRFHIKTAFHLIERALRAGRDVVIPADGLGTGLAELPTRAPIIFAAIERRVADLEQTYGVARSDDLDPWLADERDPVTLDGIEAQP